MIKPGEAKLPKLFGPAQCASNYNTRDEFVMPHELRVCG